MRVEPVMLNSLGEHEWNNEEPDITKGNPITPRVPKVQTMDNVLKFD